MGQFSWYAQDTLDPIWNDYDKFKIYMVDPLTGEKYEENDYEGYGVFGGRDYYELLATINYPIAKYLNPEYFNDDIIDKTLYKLHNKKLSWQKLSPEETSALRKVGIDIEYGDTHNYYMYPVLVHVYGEWINYKYIKPIHHSGQGGHPNSDERDDYHTDMWSDDEDQCTSTTHLLNYQKYVYNKFFLNYSITFDNFKASIENEKTGNKVNITFKHNRFEPLEIYGDFKFIEMVSSKMQFIENVFNAPKIQHYRNRVYNSKN